MSRDRAAITGRRTLTRAPMTPNEVKRRYSKGRVLEVVFKNGYKKSGIWAMVRECAKRREL